MWYTGAEQGKIISELQHLLLLDKGQILTKCRLFHSLMYLSDYDIYSSENLSKLSLVEKKLQMNQTFPGDVLL